ncbi:MAG: DUF6515 family protein, partial [Planctomycetes bacterium]|nr:DUF6515 family protein [Planctomycetota bacterium]
DTLPAGSLAVSAGGNAYHYHGGRYYAARAGGYAVVAPPIGCRIPLLPPGSTRHWWRNRWYWYHGGCYYNYWDDTDDYEVVEAPVGAIVDELPEGAEKVVVDGKTYWKVGDTWYRPVYSMGGELKYEVVKL